MTFGIEYSAVFPFGDSGFIKVAADKDPSAVRKFIYEQIDQLRPLNNQGSLSLSIKEGVQRDSQSLIKMKFGWNCIVSPSHTTLHTSIFNYTAPHEAIFNLFTYRALEKTYQVGRLYFIIRCLRECGGQMEVPCESLFENCYENLFLLFKATKYKILPLGTLPIELIKIVSNLYVDSIILQHSAANTENSVQ